MEKLMIGRLPRLDMEIRGANDEAGSRSAGVDTGGENQSVALARIMDPVAVDRPT